jgi:hypothetical protein
MITNTGQSILAKYLVGHTPSYASHIAVGCGPKPLGPLDFPAEYSNDFATKETLGFEMFRIPITSRGFVNESGNSYVVFTGELPTQERYSITEVGVFSAAANPTAGISDSKVLYSFSEAEGWEYHSASEVVPIPLIRERLDEEGGNTITAQGTLKAFSADSENTTFSYLDRKQRQEAPRFLNNSILMRGDSSFLSINANGNLVANDDISDHVHLTGTTLNLDRNAPTDLIKLAFSVVNEQGEDPLDPESVEVVHPESVRISVQFVSGETGQVDFANFDAILVDGEDGVDFVNNRYYVVTKQIQELVKSISFSWDQVSIVKVYASVIFGTGQQPSHRFWVALDGLRLENVTSVNPLYGLTGYTVLKTDDELPVIKNPNSSNFIEFRFAFETGFGQSGGS